MKKLTAKAVSFFSTTKKRLRGLSCFDLYAQRGENAVAVGEADNICRRANAVRRCCLFTDAGFVI